MANNDKIVNLQSLRFFVSLGWCVCVCMALLRSESDPELESSVKMEENNVLVFDPNHEGLCNRSLNSLMHAHVPTRTATTCAPSIQAPLPCVCVCVCVVCLGGWVCGWVEMHDRTAL